LSIYPNDAFVTALRQCPLLAQSGHANHSAMSAFGGKADIEVALSNVRFLG
jgi:hypothetical protein